MGRIDKNNYYLDIAEIVLERSTCLRRWYGSVIVKNDEIIATGYNGSPRGKANCCDIGYCPREVMSVPHGQRYELCESSHSEMNAIISARRQDMMDSTLYLTGLEYTGEYIKDAKPCKICSKLIANSGISRLVIRRNKNNYEEIIL